MFMGVILSGNEPPVCLLRTDAFMLANGLTFVKGNCLWDGGLNNRSLILEFMGPAR
jgi:hypothetical protein